MTLYCVFAALLLVSLAFLLAPLRHGDAPKRQRLYFAAAVGGVFFIGGFGMYEMFGAPGIIPLLAARQAEMARLKEDIVSNSQRVKTDPKNLAAWVKLGEDFMETGQFDAAANAFRQAVVLARGNPNIIVAYARAQIEAAGGKVTASAKKSLEMALLQQPKNEMARYYLIVWQLQNGQTAQAMQAMKKFYASLPKDSPVKTMIDAEIGK
ncbi:MAG: hypothetical protein KGI29_03660 [Pseudomonadota bacterium]|nr:hypothetical protein [Pseudomonadota bacterium]MDE3037651.1 hypothetical protein [Pseudomonadota bacterium]